MTDHIPDPGKMAPALPPSLAALFAECRAADTEFAQHKACCRPIFEMKGRHDPDCPWLLRRRALDALERECEALLSTATERADYAECVIASMMQVADGTFDPSMPHDARVDVILAALRGEA